MKSIAVQSVSTARNAGIRREHDLYYTLTGALRTRHDSGSFDKGSDIEEFHMSVKASHFTLATVLFGDTLEEMVADYFNRTASECFAYVTEDYTAYIMDAVEFRSLLLTFARLERGSSKNGGKITVRFPRESRKVLEWFATRA